MIVSSVQVMILLLEPKFLLRLIVLRLNSTIRWPRKPREICLKLILKILEFSCASIIQDLTTTPALGPFSIPVNHFLQLRLVCNCFNSILTDSIRFEGRLIEDWLLDKQTWNWSRLKRRDTIENIRQVCGSVWYNPGFFETFRYLFCNSGTSEDVSVYRAPEIFTQHLTENGEYCGSKTGEQSIIYTTPKIVPYRRKGGLSRRVCSRGDTSSDAVSTVCHTWVTLGTLGHQ